MTTRVLSLTGIAHARRLFLRSIVRGLKPTTVTIKGDDGKTEVPATETLVYVSHETIIPHVVKLPTPATVNVTCNVVVVPVAATPEPTLDDLEKLTAPTA